uniref:Phosphomevalonate dehydratase large subunit n=1 Tax=Thermofilum pendens TaxID=2269 RepID=A0A7J3X8V7_THEPE
MHLTREEELALEGYYGEALSIAMRVVVKVAEVSGAERLVPIKHAHISGISFRNIGEEGLEFLESLASKGARFAVPTTINPGAFDLEKRAEMNVEEDAARGQLRILEALKRMGAKPTLSCTPYLYERISFRDHLAWSESNAVLYANSVVGAMTNRDGGPLALFEAIAGRAPLSGLHLEENRVPSLLVDFSAIRSRLLESGLIGVAGLVTGRIAGSDVPLVCGLSFGSEDEVKLYLAAVGATGGTGLVLLEGLSPDLKHLRFSEHELERFAVDWSAVEAELERYSGAGDGVAVVGCPHLSRRELAEILDWVRRHGGAKRRLILFASRAAVEGLELSEPSVEVYADTCMVVSDLPKYAGRSVVTDSGKAAFYLASQGNAVRLVSRGELLRYVVGERG